MDILECILSLGGMAPTFRLARLGWSGRALARAIHEGHIVRVRQGWYASSALDPRHLSAARVGGRLTCFTGAAEHGIWIRENNRLHIAVAATASRLRAPSDMRRRIAPADDVIVHWRKKMLGSAFIESPLACLIDLASCEEPVFVVAAVDSALHMGLVTKRQWLVAISSLPAGLKLQLSDIDSASESGIESVSRLRFRAAGLSVRTQVWLATDIRVDLLVGERFVVEVDGSQHSDPSHFERDRVRDARLSALGYQVLHFTYRQVMFDWPSVLASVRSAVAMGDAHFVQR